MDAVLLCRDKVVGTKFLEEKFPTKDVRKIVVTTVKEFIKYSRKNNVLLFADRSFKPLLAKYEKQLIFIDLQEYVPKAPSSTPAPEHPIRKRIFDILQEYGPLHGYEIAKIYVERFGKVNLRLIYYHLYRGVKEGVFERVFEREEPGAYSWGRTARRVYYRVKGQAFKERP